MECVKHPGTPVVSVCVTCGISLVCLDCMTGYHTSHMFVKPDEAAKNIKSKLQTQKVQNEKFITKLQSDIKDVTAAKLKHEGQGRKNIHKINKQRQTLHQAVDEIADKLIAKYVTNIKNTCDRVEKAICDILSTIENVKRHNYNLNKILDDKDDLTALQSSVKLEDVVRHRTPYHEPVSIEFTQGKVNANHLQQMFGGHATGIETLLSQQGNQAATDFYISTAKGSDFEGTLIRHGRKIVFETTFQHSSYNFVAEMYPWSNKSTWFRLMQENKLELTDRHGHVEKTVSFDTKIRGMTGQSVSGTDSLMICGVEDRVIKRVEMPSGQITAEFSTGNLYPYAICTATSGDFFVTLVETEDYTVATASERVLVKYSAKGQEMRRVCLDSRGEILFVIPRRVRISNTGNIVGVKNSTDPENNHLVLLNTNLTFRSRYLGHGRVVSGETFDTTTYKPDTNYAITDFIFDSFDNIIICENYSRSVQMLTKDCRPMLTIISTQEFIPASLTLNDDKMWIGFNDGTVEVYQYH